MTESEMRSGDQVRKLWAETLLSKIPNAGVFEFEWDHGGVDGSCMFPFPEKKKTR